MMDAAILTRVLRAPEITASLDADGWMALLTIARAEQLIGTLACRLKGLTLPVAVEEILDDARGNAEYQRRSALWEANRAAAALKNYAGKVVLMKGTAYHAANLKACEGRHVGDLDIMVAENDLKQVESALLAAGWEWVKEDDYDDAYYRDHMHELPPLIHKDRDRMADVHHTILPKTARPTPDAIAMLDGAILVDADMSATSGPLFIFAPADMAIHCAAHLIADGELDGGLRNLWDFHCLIQEFSARDSGFQAQLLQRAIYHQLAPAVERIIRLSCHLYGDASARLTLADRLFLRRLLARNGNGQPIRKITRLFFYIRSHWLRMPPLMLARHLWTKWRKGQG